MGATVDPGAIISVAKLLKDPYLIFIFIMFAILSWLIVRLLKINSDHLTYERELLSELHSNSQTLVRLTTLIESLINGRRRGGD